MAGNIYSRAASLNKSYHAKKTYSYDISGKQKFVQIKNIGIGKIKCSHPYTTLTNFNPMLYLCTSWKRQEVHNGFLEFSEGIEIEYWAEMG